MKPHAWTAAIVRAGSRAVLPLPAPPADIWGARGRFNLNGTVGGAEWRGTPVAVGDGWGLPLGPTWLRDAGRGVGDEVSAEVGLEGPQIENLPEDFRAALEADPAAYAAFDASTSFCRNNYLRWIEDAKRADTRAARIARAVELLIAGRDRP